MSKARAKTTWEPTAEFSYRKEQVTVKRADGSEVIGDGPLILGQLWKSSTGRKEWRPIRRDEQPYASGRIVRST